MRILQYCSWAIGVGLEVLLVAALLRGGYRRFPFLFAYCLVLLLTTVVEVAAYTTPASLGSLAHSRELYYWVDDVILQVLMYCLVISMIYQASAKAERRRFLRRWLIAGALLIFAASFSMHYDPRLSLSNWMTRVSRDLSFCSVILDLLLWSLLIASKKRNQQLLMLSGGLGIQLTGAAIGQSLRQLSRATLLAGNLILVSTALMCLYVWWQTFRHDPGYPTRRIS